MKKLLIVIGLLICVACAQKPSLKMTPEQSEKVLRAQFDAREAYGNWMRSLASLQAACDEVIKDNKWPKETTCSAKTAQDVQLLLVTPVSFSMPDKPKEAKK